MGYRDECILHPERNEDVGDCSPTCLFVPVSIEPESGGFSPRVIKPKQKSQTMSAYLVGSEEVAAILCQGTPALQKAPLAGQQRSRKPMAPLTNQIELCRATKGVVR
jgi:hypothetical protein